MRRGCLTVADPIADALGLPPDVWVTGQGRRFGGPGPALPLSGALPRFAADGPVSRQRRRVGRDVATVAGSSRECGTGSDREGIDGTSPSGIETLARMCCKSLSGYALGAISSRRSVGVTARTSHTAGGASDDGRLFHSHRDGRAGAVAQSGCGADRGAVAG